MASTANLGTWGHWDRDISHGHLKVPTAHLGMWGHWDRDMGRVPGDTETRVGVRDTPGWGYGDVSFVDPRGFGDLGGPYGITACGGAQSGDMQGQRMGGAGAGATMKLWGSQEGWGTLGEFRGPRGILGEPQGVWWGPEGCFGSPGGSVLGGSLQRLCP